MSKAFTNEDTPIPDDADALPPRAVALPITPAGVVRLQSELTELRRAGSSDLGVRRARIITQALASIYIVEPSAPDGRVAFGALVTVEDVRGQTIEYELVGPDEVDVSAGRISAASPVGQALLGKRAGDTVVLRRPKGDVEVTVISVAVP